MTESMPKRYKRLVKDLNWISANEEEDILRKRHQYGIRLLRDEEWLLRWNARGNGNIMERLAKDTKKSKSFLYRVMRFARKYPDIENFIRTYKVQLGDKLTWTYVVENLLYDSDEVEPTLTYLIKRRFRRSLHRRQIVERLVAYHKLDERQVKLLLSKIPKGKVKDFEGIVDRIILGIKSKIMKGDDLRRRVEELFEFWREKRGTGIMDDNDNFVEFNKDYFRWEVVAIGVTSLEREIYRPYPPVVLSLPSAPR